MWKATLKTQWLLPVLVALATLPAQAAHASRWPLLELTQLAGKDGKIHDLHPTLSVHMKAGAPGAIGLFFTAPEFDKQGHALRNPDEILSDLSNPIPIKFKEGRLWVLLYPTPASEMDVLCYAKVAGEEKRVGVFVVTTDKKGSAHFAGYQFEPDFIFEDKGVVLEQMTGLGPGAFKHLPLSMKL